MTVYKNESPFHCSLSQIPFSSFRTNQDNNNSMLIFEIFLGIDTNIYYI